MGLIDGTTRDECQALEDQLQSYAANEQWIQAWNTNEQGLVATDLQSFVTVQGPVSSSYSTAM